MVRILHSRAIVVRTLSNIYKPTLSCVVDIRLTEKIVVSDTLSFVNALCRVAREPVVSLHDQRICLLTLSVVPFQKGSTIKTKELMKHGAQYRDM